MPEPSTKPLRQQPALPWIEADEPLPLANTAWGEDSRAPGLLAAGLDLSPSRIREAYSKGIFPWFSESQPVLWWSTDPRMVLMVNQFRIHRSFKKTLNAFILSPNCEVRIDSDFKRVIENCAQRPPKTDSSKVTTQGNSTGGGLSAGTSGTSGANATTATTSTWILPQMQSVYAQAHREGFVHSVETWENNQLVGGLYCVSLGKAVYGESMFSLQKDASKIALAALVAFSIANGIHMIDCQQNTSHLSSLGAAEIPRSKFLELAALAQNESSPQWQFSTDYWGLLGLQVKTNP